MRSKVVKVTPSKAQRWLDESNLHNRPLSVSLVRSFADAMGRGDWKVTHQGVAFDANGTLVDGQHRLAAVVEAGIPVDLTVFTDVPTDTFDVLDTGKRRNSADTLAIEGEKYPHMLAAMTRAVYLYHHRSDGAWTGRAAAVTNHQILQTLAEHPRLREFVSTGERLANSVGMIKSAAGASAYLTERDAKPGKIQQWYDGIIDGTGLTDNDPRLTFRHTMFRMARKESGQVQRRRDTREHVALYLNAFNAWATDQPLPRLRYQPREALPPIAKP
ncbi:MAG: hypothetical protein J2O49_03155 [Sciscionella sp.]|nr:hypothetical protein [Sciscionella sp.]